MYYQRWVELCDVQNVTSIYQTAAIFQCKISLLGSGFAS